MGLTTLFPGDRRGAGLALLSAALFGASTPAAKLLLGAVDPWMLAGLLYLGSGVGLAALRILQSATRGATGDAPLRGSDWLWLAGAIATGGVLGPVLLMLGLTITTAASASLMLNLEGVLTAVVAWTVFRENTNHRIVIGFAAIVTGAVLLGLQGPLSGGVAGPLLIAAACLCWALDNNFTGQVSLANPTHIAMLKGLVAGTVNLALAFATGMALPGVTDMLAACALGAVGYGVSLVLFILALRRIGTARTGAYFSTAPFLGAVIAVALLGDPITLQVVIAGLLMAIGVWLHLTERHEHMHEHEALEHEHRHVHDEHHQHEHGPGAPPGEPHVHRHAHTPLRHAHPHYPDPHHRHSH